MEFVWLVVVLLAATSSADVELPWWRTASLYEVYPRSFKDSDGDGTGDLKGVIQKADYLKELGVDAIWLTPFFTSPMVDFGYDIADFNDVDPTFGNMDDFDALLKKCKEIGMKVVMDFVPNHSSDQHPWFQASADPSHPLHNDYRDFYVWMDPKGTTSEGQPIPPNNWMSLFGGIGWQWSDKRKQFYLHHFAVQQPDLNFRNPNVLGNMTAVIDFWIDKGIDGFRIDAGDHIFEDSQFRDEPLKEGVSAKDATWFDYIHTAMVNQPETFQLLDDWADHIYVAGLEKGRHIPMFLEIYCPIELSMKYYGTGKRSLKIPFNFLILQRGHTNMQPVELKTIIDQWVTLMPKDGVANWVIGNHDNKRVATHFGSEMLDTMNMLTAILPGVQVIYQGDEIGMEDTAVPYSLAVDPTIKGSTPDNYQSILFRDPERTPMQWDNTLSAGFSSNKKTWLPLNPNYWWLNVEAERAAPASHLKVFQAMAKVRKDPVLQRGDLKVLVPDDDTLVVVRSYKEKYFAMVANLGYTPATYTTENMFGRQGLDMDMEIVVASTNSGYKPGTLLKKGTMSITLRPKASVVLRSSSLQLFHSVVLLLLCILVSTFVSWS